MLVQWWKNVSIARKLYSIVGIMAVLIVCELMTLRFAMHTLSAARAFVSGEGLWSKAQKNALISLQRYGVTRSEEDFQTFLDDLKIPEGDRQARLELMKPEPNLSVVRDGFLRGRIHPSDIDPMIDLLRRFSTMSYLARAVEVWTDADALMSEFKAAGLGYHAAVVANDPVRAAETMAEIKTLNESMTAVEDEFSYVLGIGSRWLEDLVLTLLFFVVMVVESVGLFLAFLTSRSISSRLGVLNAAAVQIGRGDFAQPAAPLFEPSQDEIGQLARAIVQTGQMLQHSYAELEARVRTRTLEVARSRNQLDVILRGISDGITVIDDKGTFVYANEAGARMCGASSIDEFLKTPQAKFFENIEMLDEEGKPFPLEKLPSRMIFKDGVENPPETLMRARIRGTGEEFWTLIKSAPVFDETRKAKLVVTIFKDFTAHKRSEDALKFLDDASVLLASSMDYEATLRRVAGIAVPKLADWCAIDIIENDGQPRSLAMAHVDPAKVSLAHDLNQQYPPDWSAAGGAPNVIRSGKSELHVDIRDEQLVAASRDGGHLAALRSLGFRSAMIVPLSARGKTFGAITFVMAESSRHYSAADLRTAEELARRAGLAIDSAALYNEAQKAIHLRDEFMSIASHELKTPITSLSLQMQMAQRTISRSTDVQPSPEKLAKMFDVSTKQVDRLTRLVEDLLDVSRIQSGRLSLTFERIDLSTIIRDTAGWLTNQLKRAGNVLELDLEDNVVGFLDHARMEQIVDNLLSNAIKYAPGKPVKVSLTQAGGSATLKVQDHGPGIPREKWASIFERFERAVAPKTVGGLGLGLFIVRQIVQGHGGSVRVESAMEQGSTFIVELPLGAKATVEVTNGAGTVEKVRRDA